MNGSKELSQLAQLLRLGAAAARDVASVRPMDREEIERLALQAEDMAGELDAMVTPDRAPLARPHRGAGAH